MERKRGIEPSRHIRSKLPRIIVSPYIPPTPEELERRKRAAEEILRVRAEIGSIGKSVTDLIRADRESH